MCWFGELSHHMSATLVAWTLEDMGLNPILRGKDGLPLLSSVHPFGPGMLSELGCLWSLQNWLKSPPLNDRSWEVHHYCSPYFLITTGCVIIIPVCYELSQYLLDVVQNFMLGLGSLFMCLHAMTEIIIIVVISHIAWYESYLHRDDGREGSVATGFFFIIEPLRTIGSSVSMVLAT